MTGRQPGHLERTKKKKEEKKIRMLREDAKTTKHFTNMMYTAA